MRAKIAAPALLLALVLVGVCRPVEPTAESIVAEARRVHGSALLDTAAVRFAFRGDCYGVTRDDGRLHVERVYRDTVRGEFGPYWLTLRDRYGPDGISRELAREHRTVRLSEREAQGIVTQLNSVAYFALLPYNLTDPSVRLRRLPDDTIRGQPYQSVEVTFSQEGGGRDWQDRFVYWFHRDRHTLDYLAYHYHTDGGGTRFRVATHPRVIRGVQWQDYENYTDSTLGTRIEAYP
ncbi:MAG TPA: DUF6503 family protein, partial [Rhodothermales bacterium]|nr:DUF6503 family protein [Rhodothermales bacterium]